MEFTTVKEWEKKRFNFRGWFACFSLLNSLLSCGNRPHCTHLCISISTVTVQKDHIYFIQIQYTVAAQNCIFWFQQTYEPHLHPPLQPQITWCLSRFTRLLHWTRFYFFIWMWYYSCLMYLKISRSLKNFKASLVRHIIMWVKKKMWKLHEQPSITSKSAWKISRGHVNSVSTPRYWLTSSVYWCCALASEEEQVRNILGIVLKLRFQLGP